MVLNVKFFKKLLNLLVLKRHTIIRNKGSEQAKSRNDIIHDEATNHISDSQYQWHHLDPLHEVIYSGDNEDVTL